MDFVVAAILGLVLFGAGFWAGSATLQRRLRQRLAGSAEMVQWEAWAKRRLAEDSAARANLEDANAILRAELEDCRRKLRRRPS